MKNFNLIMTFVLLAVLICVILRNNIENFQTNQVALNNATLSYGNVPPGTIVSWCHDAEFMAGRLSTDNTANIPDGWVVCDGRTYTKTDGSGTGNTPNLVGKFIYGGKGQAYANVNPPSNTTGEYSGGNENNFGNAGMYTGVTSDDHANVMYSNGKYKVTLTKSEMPSHRHRLLHAKTNTIHGNIYDGDLINPSDPSEGRHPSEVPVGHGGAVTPPPGSNLPSRINLTSKFHHEIYTTWGGGNETPIYLEGTTRPVTSRIVTNQAHENMPPYYTLVYIMKKY